MPSPRQEEETSDHFVVKETSETDQICNSLEISSIPHQEILPSSRVPSVVVSACKKTKEYYTKRRIRLPKDEDNPDRLAAGLILKAILASFFVFCLVSVLYQWQPCILSLSSSCSIVSNLHPALHNHIRGQHNHFLPPLGGLASYFDLFFPIRRNYTSSTDRTNDRRLATETSKLKDPQLVIAGKMIVENAPCNIAQYDMKDKQWSLEERIQLSLYNSYSGGEVYSLLANHTEENTFDQGDFSVKR